MTLSRSLEGHWSGSDQSQPRLMGGHHAGPRPHRVGTNERTVRPKLGWGSPSPLRRVQGAVEPPTPDDTPSGAPATRGGDEMEGFESPSEGIEGVEDPWGGQNVSFPLSFPFVFFFWREGLLGDDCRSGMGQGYIRKSPPPLLRHRRSRCRDLCM